MCVPLLLACPSSEVDNADTETSGDGDGDGDPSGDGDGDGDPSGDGDGDPSGDGDGDPSGDGDGDGDPSGDGDGDGDPNCTGPNGTQPIPANAAQPDTPMSPGSTWAYFELEDFQPQSCNFGQTYSLETFKGRVTLFTLMRSTCEICQGTLEKLEQMQAQLTLKGHEVWFVALNQDGYADTQQEFIDRASFPLVQDTAQANAWGLMNEIGLGTDDIYIYDSNGVLHSYFNYADANPSIDLNTQSGWDTVYGAVIAALEG
ncbi:Multiple EGF-like-domain protein 3 precursor [Enhygromyxa salina]|uniref:Multiple EGF-like-domain protein 3 n=2 Tax=Enhygromyxa salina TaxID=215803 RepID=A0A0C1ZT96_9BACT|nr:Multiple EGF-like-domain protein 3 precursor [Enhygromyxa salina]